MADEVIAGRYRLLEPLGRGAMSSVWLAEDEELGRRVAVKTLAESADRARFDREARAAAALSHPHICQLYDYGEADGRPYMVLEYLPGGTLEDVLRSGRPLPDEDTHRIAGEVASGLAHAHARGLVHRDLKPANVLFDAEGRAKIADFGIARMGGSGTLTEAGTVLGTASYISPEQAAGRPASPASDVYSFGVILFRMLTGRLPFTSQNAMELVRMHRDDTPPPVSVFRADAPARLESVAAAALAKDPADRPADGAALVSELTAPGEATSFAPAAGAATQVFRSGAGGDATQVVARPLAARRRRASRAPLLLLGLLALVAAGAALAYVATRPDDTTAPNTTEPLASLSLPNVVPGKRTTSSRATTTQATTATTEPATTAATSTRATTSAPRTTAPATTAPPPPPTTHRTTTAPPPTTTAPPPLTTTAPPPTTTAPPPTTTEPPPTTTAAPPGQAKKQTTTTTP